jgi:hypothetical protein
MTDGNDEPEETGNGEAGDGAEEVGDVADGGGEAGDDAAGDVDDAEADAAGEADGDAEASDGETGDGADPQRNGRPEPYRLFSVDGPEGRSGVRIRIGREDVRLDEGVHDYRIVYETERWLRFGEGRDSLTWNVTGNGWTFPIRSVSAAVSLPGPVAAGEVELDAWTGPTGSRARNASVAWDEEAGAARYRTTAALGPREGLTVRLTLPSGLISPPTEAQRSRWFRLDWGGYLDAGLVAVLVLAVGTAASAVVPGSPVHGWITDAVRAVAGTVGDGGRSDGSVPEGEAANPTTAPQEWGLQGVKIPVTDSAVVRVPEPSSGQRLRIRSIRGGLLSVTGRGARYRAGSGAIEVTAVGDDGELHLAVPESAAAVRVTAGGRILVEGTGRSLRFRAARVDTVEDGYVVHVPGDAESVDGGGSEP